MSNAFRFAFLLLSAALLQPLAAAPVKAQDAGEILLRLDRLEAENRRLTGQLEQSLNQVRRLEDQLKRFQADVDFRFQEMAGGKPGAARPAVSPAPAGAPVTPGQKRSDAFDPDAQPGVAGAPRTLGPGNGSTIQPLATGPKIPASGIIVEDQTRGGAGQPGEPLPLGGAAPRGVASSSAAIPAKVGGGSAQDDLTLARGLLERGDFELAEGQFREFMRSYPQDRLVPEAAFGLGETYFLRQRYQEAAEQYLNLSTKYPKSGRAPEGLLKLAMSLRAIGERTQACGTLAEIGRKYPTASATVKQAVEREQKRSRC